MQGTSYMNTSSQNGAAGGFQKHLAPPVPWESVQHTVDWANQPRVSRKGTLNFWQIFLHMYTKATSRLLEIFTTHKCLFIKLYLKPFQSLKIFFFVLGPWSPIASYMRKLWNGEGYDIHCHKVQRKFYSTHTQKLILFFILKQFHSEAELGWQTKALVVLLWSGEPAHSPRQQSSQETPHNLGQSSVCQEPLQGAMRHGWFLLVSFCCKHTEKLCRPQNKYFCLP